MAKFRVLCWSDSASATTGFGIVSKYVLKALHETGQYDIYQLAINFPNRFVDTQDIPWQQISTRLLDPGDPFGKKMFLKTLGEMDFDYIWILNDIYITCSVVEEMRKILNDKAANGKKVPKILYYYPVDCHVGDAASDMIFAADIPVCYNDYGRQETLLTHSDLGDKLIQIPHGVNTSVFRPLGRESQVLLKRKYVPKNAEKFLFLSVGRNSDRKQISRTILAFSEFKKEVPDSVLLLHTLPVDKSLGRMLDLFAAVKDLNLDLQEDILFPKYYDPSVGVPEEVLNDIYNLADCYISTSVGEGYGLPIAESMAAGTPVIVGDNTNMRDFVGKNSERGYIYSCREKIFFDGAGYRPYARLDDILYQMFAVYRAGNKYDNPKVYRARKWAENNDWSIICQKWIELFKDLETQEKVEDNNEIKGIIL